MQVIWMTSLVPVQVTRGHGARDLCDVTGPRKPDNLINPRATPITACDHPETPQLNFKNNRHIDYYNNRKTTMPCLLNLPPELIEQIYNPFENDDDEDNMIDFRLTCKYIEKSTRRSFRRWHFAWKVIKMNDASIERVCVTMQTPDLANSIEELEIHAEDDGTAARKAREKHSGVEICSVDRFTLARLENADQLVPAALLRHSDALLAALSAT
jgi:hypothetical protein